jgi:hypothetical protein
MLCNQPPHATREAAQQPECQLGVIGEQVLEVVACETQQARWFRCGG